MTTWYSLLYIDSPFFPIFFTLVVRIFLQRNNYFNGEDRKYRLDSREIDLISTILFILVTNVVRRGDWIQRRGSKVSRYRAFNFSRGFLEFQFQYRSSWATRCPPIESLPSICLASLSIGAFHSKDVDLETVCARIPV